MKLFGRYAAYTAVFLTPVLASAQVISSASSCTQGLCMVLGKVGALIQMVTPLIVALALLAFFWGLAMYMFSLGNEGDKDKKKGRDLMVYGILTLFVMVAVWGLVQILNNTVFGTSSVSSSAPQIPYIIPNH